MIFLRRIWLLALNYFWAYTNLCTYYNVEQLPNVGNCINILHSFGYEDEMHDCLMGIFVVYKTVFGTLLNDSELEFVNEKLTSVENMLGYCSKVNDFLTTMSPLYVDKGYNGGLQCCVAGFSGSHPPIGLCLSMASHLGELHQKRKKSVSGKAPRIKVSRKKAPTRQRRGVYKKNSGQNCP
jgi:hypothetical protein